MAQAPNFKPEIDAAFNDFRKEFVSTLSTVINESLPAAVDAVTPSVQRAWAAAAKAHFQAHVPHAYRRTGALQDQGIAGVFSEGVTKLSETELAIGVTVMLSGMVAQILHKHTQQTLKMRDPKGIYATEIKYPAMSGSGRHYYMYPNDRKVGVVGSMQEQKKPYLVEYIMAGPNMPNQPIVYRWLGQPKNGAKTERDAARGHELLDSFLKVLGIRRPVSLSPDMEGTYVPGQGIMDSLSEYMATAIKTKMKISIGEDALPGVGASSPWRPKSSGNIWNDIGFPWFADAGKALPPPTTKSMGGS